jgi:hypothetical protein
MIVNGCRVGEALALKWTEVNLANQTLRRSAGRAQIAEVRCSGLWSEQILFPTLLPAEGAAGARSLARGSGSVMLP